MVPRRRSDAKRAATAFAIGGGMGRPTSLRKTAAELGVSHEAIRQAMIAAGQPTDLESRNRAIREMAAGGVP
jgi:hypothetical protein